ncbi:hypothetical protein AB0B45_13945 [Nonomuraea sp. NPDC049152]
MAIRGLVGSPGLEAEVVVQRRGELAEGEARVLFLLRWSEQTIE